MRLFNKKFKNVDLIPSNPLAITFYQSSGRNISGQLPRFGISFWGMIAASAIVVLIYPFLPVILYNINPPQLPQTQSVVLGSFDIDSNEESPAQKDVAYGSVYENRIIIPKIGVNIKISDLDNETDALSEGAWRFSQTSTPDKGSNTAFSAHRYQYLPPHSETFYLLDKLEVGDRFTIVWEGKQYTYSVFTSMIVAPYAVEVLNPSQKSTVTLITCNPLFSTKERLVVKAELVSVD